MKKGLIAIFVVILVIFISGCGNTGQAPTPTDYHRGTQGITMSFMTNSPPTTVFHGDTVPFIVEIRNLGAHTTNPKIWLSGHDTKIIVHEKWRGKLVGDIEAKDENNPIGGYEPLEEKSIRIELPENVDSYDTNMKLTACYLYTTHASVQLCVDPDPTSNQDDACTAGDMSLSGGQGGPVAITHIDQDSTKDKVRFAITIANQGDGTVIRENTVTSGSCTNLKASDIDVVELSSPKISRFNLDCKPSKEIRLVNGRGLVYCDASFDKDAPKTAFTTLLTLDIKYGYKSSISKTINVKRI